MGRKVCFIPEASSQGNKVDPCSKVNSPTNNQRIRAFKGEFQGCTSRQRGLHAETTQSAPTTIFRLVLRWSDQRHPGCFKYSSFSAPESICSHCFEASSWNCGSLGNSSEKAMATHSSTLVWQIPWTEEPGRLQSMGSRRVKHD